MDERELVLTSLIYPLIFREAAQIGIATPVSAHIRELLKIQTPEPEVIRVGNATPVSALIRNIFQNYEHPLQDFAQIGIATPHSAYIKNIFNEHPQPIEAVTQIGIATPVSAHHVNLLKNLQTFKTDHVVQVSNAIPEAVYSTCKPVVFTPTNLRGQYNGESIQLYWTNNSITHSHQNLYRSTTPFTESNLPPVYQYIFRGVNSYIDENVVEGVTYYYAVSTEAGLVQLVSNVTRVVTVEVSNCDPHWDKVVALLHFDAGLTDVTGRVWVNHDSNLTFGVAPDGTSCLRIEQPLGVSAGLSCDESSDFNFTSDFTIECMVWSDSTGQNLDITSNTLGYWHSPGVTWRVDGGRERFVTYGPPVAITSSQIPTEGWVHLALVRVNNGILIFRDGVKVLEWPNYYSGQVRFDYGGTRLFSYMGYSQTGAFNGYVKEYRATKGVARYTENFTPPTEPFPSFGCAVPQFPEVIGEEFGGGYYIGDITIPDGPDAGTYAIIMAGIEGQDRLAWKNPHSATPGTSSTVDGMANTLTMQANNPDIHYAGIHCLNYRGNSHDDWYMPAVDELNLAWLNRDVLAGLAMEPQSYWSSMSIGSTSFYATYQNFSTGAQANSIMSNSLRVRPVRRIRKPD